MLTNASHRGLGLSGVSEQAAEDLRPFLIEHGVPPEQATNRAQSAVKAIGGAQILGALASKLPWKSLKTLGNQVKFQFLLPAELQAKIQSGAGGSVGKPKGRKSRKPGPVGGQIVLDPTKLSVPEGTFAAGGTTLQQIPLSAVGPIAEGIVLVSQQEAEPYLLQGRRVSNHPLALFVLSAAEVETSLAHSALTIPCRCLANNEPILVDGVVCQIGNGFVEKGHSMSQVAVDTVAVAALKFLVYKDEIECSWETFIEGPLRYIVSKIPRLRLCQQPQCGCPHWHNHEGVTAKEAILDVWRRQFLQGNFRPEAAAQATMYTVSVRVPEVLLQHLLHASGTAGIYCEPRTLDARAANPDYSVVWLPKMNRSQLNHLKQTTPATLGVARVGERVGLRVLASQAASVHQTLKPESIFLPAGPKQEFLAGPFPFGSDRNSLLRAFRALKWEARPLQPLSSIDTKGSMWLVQATEDPPDSILPMSHGDVVVTRHKKPKEVKDPKPRPVASADTLALCGNAAQDGSKDPWLNSDPWGGFKATTQAPVAADATDGLKQLEAKVTQAVLSSLPAPSTQMERDDLPDRMLMLENQMQSIIQKNVQMEAQMQEQAAAQTTQLAAMQHQMTSHGQQLHGHMEAQQQNIAALFEAQMNQIRALMSKRTREEHE